MKYYVHIYAVCRRKVGPIEAESQAEAVKQAAAMDMNALFDTKIGSRCEVEYAEEVQDFVVDEEGDKDYARSRVWELDGDDKPALKAGELPL